VSRFVSLVVMAIALLAISVSAWAAPSLLGISGGILTPDDTVLAPGAFNLAYHGITGNGDTSNFWGGNIGVLPNLEVGAVAETNGETNVGINAKYRILTEKANRPAVTFGVIDAAAQITDDPSLFLVISKNLTPTAEKMSSKSVGPVRGHLGFGSGILKNFFGSIDWTITPKLTLLAEIISDSKFDSSDGGDTLFNAGLRYAINNEFRIDAGTVDFNTFTYGLSYQALKF
jgi:hypothetical protein